MRMLPRAIATALAVALLVPTVAFAHWPVVNKYSWISQRYWSGHNGIDIATPVGTKIVPIRSGYVVFAGYKPDCGAIQVTVYHGNGLYSVYVHLSSVAVVKGQWVRDQSTVLGRSGSTGCSTGPHTHVSVWKGRPWASGSYTVNPWYYISTGWYLPYRYGG